jgi:hypothetical protein
MLDFYCTITENILRDSATSIYISNTTQQRFLYTVARDHLVKLLVHKNYLCTNGVECGAKIQCSRNKILA